MPITGGTWHIRHLSCLLRASGSRKANQTQSAIANSSFRLRRIIASLLLCVALVEIIPSSQAFAGNGATRLLDDYLNQWESQITTSQPGFYEGQQRGYLFGGSARFRAPIVSVSPLSLQLPRITAGCGGISMFGGSFSFINMDRFTEYLQAIAQNAVGMAFEMALTTLCPQCATVLHKLEDTIQKVNAMSSNSCQAARSLISTVGGTPEAIKAYRQERCNAINTELGTATDWFGGAFKCKTDGTAEWQANKAAQASTSDQTKPKIEPLQQNIFWKAWQKSGIQVSQDFNETGEHFMSLYGTLVLYFDENKKQKLDYKAPLLEVTDLLVGWEEKKGWVCADDHLSCLKVDEAALSAYKGGLTAIIETKLKAYAGDLRARQRYDLANDPYLSTPVAGIPLYRLLVNTAEIPGGNDYIAEHGASFIALDMLESFTKQIARYIHSQLVLEDEQGLRKQYLEDFHHRRQEIAHQLEIERRKLSQSLADLKFFNDLANGSSTRTAADFIRQVIFARTIQNNTNLIGR